MTFSNFLVSFLLCLCLSILFIFDNNFYQEIALQTDQINELDQAMTDFAMELGQQNDELELLHSRILDMQKKASHAKHKKP